MGFVEDMLPVAGTIAGAYFGGPVGAAIGGSVGAGLSSSFNNQANAAHQAEQARQNIELQREFAQQGIRWKVSDAAAAGIHPLAALGAQTHSFSPVITGGPSDNTGVMSEMGQNISRAMFANSDQKEQAKAAAGLQLEGLHLDNEMKRAQLATIYQTQQPGLPTNTGSPGSLTGAGQGDAYVIEKPHERVRSFKGHDSQEPGHISDVGFAKTKTGLAPIPSKDVKERIEDQFVPETTWAVRNQLLPNIGLGDKPSNKLLPKGYDTWMWHHPSQEWRPIKKSGGWKFSPASGFRFSEY